MTSIAVDATVNLTDYFGKGLTDKGFYYKDEDYNNKLGVIRFLQSVQNVEITEFGFYIVKGSDASIIQTQKTEVSSTEQAEAVMNNGFFTDVFGIPSGETAACLAVPFVKLKDGEKVVTGMAIQASMSEDDWNREVEFTEPTPSE